MSDADAANLNQSTPADEETRTPGSRASRIISRVFRLGVIVLLAAVGWTTARGITALFSNDAPPAEFTKDAADESPLLPQTIQALPEDGYWMFGKSPWAAGVSRVGPNELSKRFAELGSGPSRLSEDRLADGRAFLDALKRLPVSVRRASDRTRYNVNMNGLRVRAVSIGSGKAEELLGFAVALPVGGERWNLFEFRATTSVPRNSAAGHLLPVPASVKRVWSRWSRNGELLMEVLSIGRNPDDLALDWKQAGWALRKSPIGRSRSFHYLCHKNGTTILAWSPPRKNGPATLVLMRSGYKD